MYLNIYTPAFPQHSFMISKNSLTISPEFPHNSSITLPQKISDLGSYYCNMASAAL